MTEHTQGRASRRVRRHSRSQTENVKSVTQKGLALVVLLLTLVLVYTGGRMTLAGMASYQTEIFLKDWASKGQEPTPRAWAVAQAAAQRAVDLYPTANGEYLDRLGRVYSWQQFTQTFGNPEAQASRLAALDSYRASTQARPTWPHTWSRLAHTKLQLVQFDDEFRQALGQASDLGPSRIEVQREVVTIAFAAWPQLTKSERERFLESAVAYGQRDVRHMQALAAQHGLTDTLCNSLDASLKATHKLCQ